MAPLNEFESVLKEVVQAKRLSASKIEKLTQIALKSMEEDTQLVSILYRTHKNLPPAAKVSSLYVFDALSRAARHQVTKQGLTGNVNSPVGNSASFLLKVEGILEGLFQDMVASGIPESKEKTKKVLDIWVKGSTFPPKILSRLAEVINGPEKGAYRCPNEFAKYFLYLCNPAKSCHSKTPLNMRTPLKFDLVCFDSVTETKASDPRVPVHQSVTTTTPPTSTEPPGPTVADPQATLLALLAQAANAAVAQNPSQITTNTAGGGIDAAQLALLQQLALAQTASSAAPSQQAPHALLVTPGTGFPTPSLRNEPNDTHPKDPRDDRFHSPDRVNAYVNQHDDRSNARNYHKTRGWGEGRRWEDRDRDRWRDRDRDRSPQRKGTRSRSRSPPSRYSGRRDVRPYSPPRRPSYAPPTAPRAQRERSHSGDNEKDEFGRDRRARSPDSESTPPPEKPSIPSPSAPSIRDEQTGPPPSAGAKNSPTPSSSAPSATANATITTSAIGTHPMSGGQAAGQGLESFDLSTFDFTASTSWEALGKMWEVTHGHIPSTEQLMQFVMTGGVAYFASDQSNSGQNWSNSFGSAWTGSGASQGFSRGRGGLQHGNSRNVHDWRYDSDSHQETDAVVLGGSPNPHVDEDKPGSASQGGGGRMQRIGDKWVFVRNPGVEGS